MSEIAVHEIGPDFALQRLVAPVTDVFQQKESQDHIGRRAFASTSAALRVAARQGIVNRRDQLFVLQHAVRVFHPVFLQVGHLLGDEAVAKAKLLPACLNHANLSSQRPPPAFFSCCHCCRSCSRFKAAREHPIFQKRPRLAVPGGGFGMLRRNV